MFMHSSPRNECTNYTWSCSTKLFLCSLTELDLMLPVKYPAPTSPKLHSKSSSTQDPILIDFKTILSSETSRGKLGNGEHLSSWAYKYNIHAWFEKSSIQPQRTSCVTTKLETFDPWKNILHHRGPKLMASRRKWPRSAITLAFSGKCELY